MYGNSVSCVVGTHVVYRHRKRFRNQAEAHTWMLIMALGKVKSLVNTTSSFLAIHGNISIQNILTIFKKGEKRFGLSEIWAACEIKRNYSISGCKRFGTCTYGVFWLEVRKEQAKGWQAEENCRLLRRVDWVFFRIKKSVDYLGTTVDELIKWCAYKGTERVGKNGSTIASKLLKRNTNCNIRDSDLRNVVLARKFGIWMENRRTYIHYSFGNFRSDSCRVFPNVFVTFTNWFFAFCLSLLCMYLWSVSNSPQ